MKHPNVDGGIPSTLMNEYRAYADIVHMDSEKYIDAITGKRLNKRNVIAVRAFIAERHITLPWLSNNQWLFTNKEVKNKRVLPIFRWISCD